MNARVIRRSVVLFATYCVPRVLASRPKLAEPCPVLPASSGETVSMYDRTETVKSSEESSDEESTTDRQPQFGKKKKLNNKQRAALQKQQVAAEMAKQQLETQAKSREERPL